MSDDKNPFSLEENTAIFARRVLDNVRVVAQEAVKQERKRVLDLKREVRAEIEERLPDIVSKAALAYARGEHDAKAPIEVPFCHLEKEADAPGKLSEHDAYRYHLLTAIGYDPALSDGKLAVRLVPEDLVPEAQAPAPAKPGSPRMTQQMYLPPAVLSGKPGVPRTSPPPVQDQVALIRDIEAADRLADEPEGSMKRAPFSDPPDTSPGTGNTSMPPPAK